MVVFFIILVIVLLWMGRAMCSRHWADVILALGFGSAFVAVIAFLVFGTPLVELVNDNPTCTWLLCGEIVQGLVVLFPVLAAVLFLPLLFLFARRRGIDASILRPIARYVVAYALWLNVTFGYVAYLVYSTMDYHLYRVERGAEGTEDVIVMWLVMIALSSYTWASSLLSVRRAYAQYAERQGELPRHIPEGSEFMYPSVWFFVWIVVFPIVWVITYAITSP